MKMRMVKIGCVVFMILVVPGFSMPVVAQQKVPPPDRMKDDPGRIGDPSGFLRYQRWQPRRVEGMIREMKSFVIAGIDEPHRLARMEAGGLEPIIVDLGPEREIQELELQEGDPIVVHGVEGSIDEKPVLVALELATQSRQKEIRRRQDLNLKVIDAKILGIRKAKFERYDVPDQMLARVELAEGKGTAVVNLGPVDSYPSDLELQGKTVSLLVRPARIEGKDALVAEEIRLPNEKLIRVDWRTPDPE